jgi:endonuclease/exonuclease/phosphatase family metal-dependent hydrolase
MTWNLWWRFGPWEARQPAIASVLAAEAADVVCLQEVWAQEGGVDQAAALAAPLGLHVAVGDRRFRDGLSFTNAMLSRWPVVDATAVALPGADGAPGHRTAVVAVLDHPAGPLVVVSTHLDHRFDACAARVAQVTAVCELVAARREAHPSPWPVVVGGDLNATPDSDEVRLLTGRRAPPVPGLVLTDAWEVAGEGPGWTWRDDNAYLDQAAWPRRRLDYVLVSWPRTPVGQPLRARLAGTAPVDGVQPSDHAAVVVDLRDPPDAEHGSDHGSARGGGA